MNQGDIKLVIDQLNDIELSIPYEQITINKSVDMLETLGNKMAEQAAVIDRLREVLWDTNKFIDQTYSDLIGSNSLESLAARYADTLSLPLSKALAIPTDSKQILADWMREQLGESVAWCHIEGGDTFVDGLQYFKDGYSDKPLYRVKNG